MTTANGRGWLTLAPDLGDLNDQFVEFCKRVACEGAKQDEPARIEGLRRLRREMATASDLGSVTTETVQLKIAGNVVLDLAAQSWQLKVEKGSVKVHSPLQNG